MFYCENCYLLNEENTCAFCGAMPAAGIWCWTPPRAATWS